MKILTGRFSFTVLLTATLHCASAPVLVLETKQTKAYRFEIGDANVYVIQGKKNIMIDTSNPGNEEKLIKALKSINLEPKDISLVILSHGHGDHSGNAKYLKEKGSLIAGGKDDLSMFRSGKMEHRNPTGFMGRLIMPISNYVSAPFELDRLITSEGISLEEFGIEGKAFQMAGHTPGSTVTIVEKKYAFVGDLMRGSLYSGSTPTEHFFHFNRELVKENIKRLLEQGIEVFFIGHWGPISAQDAKKEFSEK